jgi:hypothetical protein
MSDNVENLMLEHLKRFQATLDRVERDIREIRTRQTETHAAVLGLRRDQLGDAELAAHLQVQLDGVTERLDRIERRLELSH